MPPLYELRDLRRGFGGREVLCIDHLCVDEGELYALLGANGAGKSTLMRILAFLDSPSSGELFFRGELTQKRQEALHRRGVILVPQFPVMFTGSLLHNIEYPMMLKNVPVAERRRRAMELLDMVGLADLRRAPARHLSGGEAQRASIARALAAEAKVLFFDEPTANVDQRSTTEIITLIRELWSSHGLSMFITTHNADMAGELCRRQIFLAAGRLVKRHILPGGRAALPSRLSLSGAGRTCVHLPPDTLQGAGTAHPAAVVRGLSSVAAGVALRLSLTEGQEADILLEDEESHRLASVLRLGDPLEVRVHGIHHSACGHDERGMPL
ncbi:MAG: ATP-binding cassette domain-containing protein [Desulfovibrio sp.]|jgi:ABC-type multidrug transport system ATPase subunit|nr:ATP-binding cassette domain-containing protein [Desulfovibrio sp.]